MSLYAAVFLVFLQKIDESSSSIETHIQQEKYQCTHRKSKQVRISHIPHPFIPHTIGRLRASVVVTHETTDAT